MTETIRTDTDISPEAWDRFVAQQPDGHVLQSWRWGEFKAEFGWQPVRVAIYHQDHIVAAAQLLLRAWPLGPLAYVPKGPVLGPATPEQQDRLWAAIHQAAQCRHAFALKVEPDWLDQAEIHDDLPARGLVPDEQTIQPRQTVLIDLTPEPEDILAAMKSKTRYNIRLASRKGVECVQGDQVALDAFYAMMETTGDRDEFGIHTRDYYQRVWELFGAQGHATLWMATYEGQFLAGIMAFAFGNKAWYMYGASSNEHRNLMPTYLVQWEAMLWAKGKGCATYDMCGIPDLPEAELEAGTLDTAIFDHLPHLWGVYRFKRGFGGQVTRYVGAYQRIYRPLRHRVFTRGLALWKSIRG